MLALSHNLIDSLPHIALDAPLITVTPDEEAVAAELADDSSCNNVVVDVEEDRSDSASMPPLYSRSKLEFLSSDNTNQESCFHTV